jgi:CubicO group peptidase (beta-lactamase class C family)
MMDTINSFSLDQMQHIKNLIQVFRKSLTIAILVCLCFTHNFAQNKYEYLNNTLTVSTPEAEGVSSAGILRFLDAVDKGKNELHSFVILRHGKIISEGWWNPYGKELKHVMYSVSKSFTSTGVGLAIAENKIKLTDRIITFFPNSLPDTLSTYMKEMTVQDLLKMSTGMNADPLFNARGSSDWPKTFLSSPVENKPGSVFKYNNMATFMLSAIVQKATGEKLLDFLKPRLFDPLGFKNITWDETPGGYTFGAIGLKLQSEDMAKFGQMLLQKGKWNGKQIVPQAWVEEATSFQIMSNAPENKTPKELNDWEQGYGYQFWRSRNNSFRADGLGGQFIIVLPEKDAVVVLTSAATNTQEELNLVWDHLLPAMLEKPLPEDKKSSAELSKRIAALSGLRTSSPVPSELLKKISGKRIEFVQNETGVKALGISFKNADAQIQIERGDEKFEIKAGLQNWQFSQTSLNSLAGPPRPGQSIPIQVASKYTWTDETTLELTSRFVEESIRSEVWILRFEENGSEVKVHIELKVFVEFMGIQSRKIEGKIVN